MASGRQTIRVAAGQCSARPMNEARLTLASLEQAIASAAERRAHLLVLPECAYPAYLLGSVASYRGGDHLSTQAFVGWLQERAARYRLHIVCGFVEDTSEVLHNGVLHNAAVLIDDQGRELGRARKRFLWHTDRDWFAPGSEIRAFDSTLGRIGVIICAETRVPEILATLIADGAELIAMPTCWVNMAQTPGRYENPQVAFLIEARAREFGVPFVCANKWGSESAGIGYVGQSRIVQADGSLAAEAGPSGETVITAEIVRQRPPQLGFTDVQRARLLSSRAPVRPSTGGPRVTLAVVPAAVVNERFTASKSETLLGPLARRGVNLLLAHAGDEDPAKRLAVLARAFDIHAIGLGPEAGVSSLGPARIGYVTGRAVRSFAASRVLTLDGAQVLMCFDVPEDLAILRSRAAENRVFVAGANDRSAIIIGPDGSVLARSCGDDPAEAIAEIDLAEAADKCVAPATDIFDGRHVEHYRF